MIRIAIIIAIGLTVAGCDAAARNDAAKGGSLPALVSIDAGALARSVDQDPIGASHRLDGHPLLITGDVHAVTGNALDLRTGATPDHVFTEIAGPVPKTGEGVVVRCAASDLDLRQPVRLKRCRVADVVSG